MKVSSIITGSALLSSCSGILEIAPTPTLTPSAILTETPTPTPSPIPSPVLTRTPEPTPTPELRKIPTIDGHFDFSRVDEYPFLDVNNFKTELDTYLKELRAHGFVHDFSKGPVDDGRLWFIDSRLNTVGNWNCLAMGYDPYVIIPEGMDPVHKVAGAKISIVSENHQFDVNLVIEQLHIAGEGLDNDGITVLTAFDNYPQSRKDLAWLNRTNMYGSLSGAFLPDILSGKIQALYVGAQVAQNLYKKGLMSESDKVMERMFYERKLLPEAHLKIFVGQASSFTAR